MYSKVNSNTHDRRASLYKVSTTDNQFSFMAKAALKKYWIRMCKKNVENKQL